MVSCFIFILLLILFQLLMLPNNFSYSSLLLSSPRASLQKKLIFLPALWVSEWVREKLQCLLLMDHCNSGSRNGLFISFLSLSFSLPLAPHTLSSLFAAASRHEDRFVSLWTLWHHTTCARWTKRAFPYRIIEQINEWVSEWRWWLQLTAFATARTRSWFFLLAVFAVARWCLLGFCSRSDSHLMHINLNNLR